MKKILDRNEINILLYSKVIEKYPSFKEYILAMHETGTKKKLFIDEEIIRFLNNTYPKVMEEAKLEWNVDEEAFEYIEDGTGVCEICGKKSINNVYAIKNSFTSKELKIGRICCRKFVH